MCSEMLLSKCEMFCERTSYDLQTEYKNSLPFFPQILKTQIINNK